MAISRDASSTIVSNTGSTPTWSHVNAGSYLVVGFQLASGETASGVVYNSVAMTQLNLQSIGGATFGNVYLFGLLNPSIGTFNIIVTKSGGSYCYGGGSSYFLVGGTDGNNKNFTTGTTETVSITTTIANDWLVGYASLDPNDTLTAGTNTSIVTLVDVWGALIDSNGPQAIGSKSLVVNRTSSNKIGINMVALSPSGTTTNASFLLKMI